MRTKRRSRNRKARVQPTNSSGGGPVSTIPLVRAFTGIAGKKKRR